jgi:uncharacterized protein
MTDYERSIEAHWEARDARLRASDGWLSLVGKTFLTPGVLTVGSSETCAVRLPEGAPATVGTLTVAAGQVRLEVDEGVEATCEGAPFKAGVLRSDARGKPDRIRVAMFALELMERGDSLALRVRHAGDQLPFAGIDRYPIDPTWKTTARFEPAAEGAAITIAYQGATDGDVISESPAAGVLIFDVGGSEARLSALAERDGRLYVLFRDATAGSDTYPTGRFVYAPPPGPDGLVELDFNKAMIPPCAFTLFATCPIPPPENRLPFAIRAGEKQYRGAPVGTED